LLIWVISINERVQELEHKETAKGSMVCAVHMYAHLARPEPHGNNMYAMAHGSLTLDTSQSLLCYKLLMANMSDTPTSIAIYGPLWSMEPEVAQDAFFNFDLPTILTEPGMYSGCSPKVGSYVYKELMTKISMFYVAVNVGPDAKEAMRGYLTWCGSSS